MATTARAAASSLASTGAGRAAGPYNAIMLTISKPGMPSSATVGSSGSIGLRAGVVTARPFSWPARICGSRLAMPSTRVSTLPAIMSVITGPAPR